MNSADTVSYTHLDVYKRQVDFRGGHQLSFFDYAHGRVMIDEEGKEVKEVEEAEEIRDVMSRVPCARSERVRLSRLL